MDKTEKRDSEVGTSEDCNNYWALMEMRATYIHAVAAWSCSHDPAIRERLLMSAALVRDTLLKVSARDEATAVKHIKRLLGDATMTAFLEALTSARGETQITIEVGRTLVMQKV